MSVARPAPRYTYLLALVASVVLPVLSEQACSQEPLFTFVQISDSQPKDFSSREGPNPAELVIETAN